MPLAGAEAAGFAQQSAAGPVASLARSGLRGWLNGSDRPVLSFISHVRNARRAPYKLGFTHQSKTPLIPGKRFRQEGSQMARSGCQDEVNTTSHIQPRVFLASGNRTLAESNKHMLRSCTPLPSEGHSSQATEPTPQQGT